MHACCEPERPCNAWCARDGSWHADMAYLNALTHEITQGTAHEDWSALFERRHHAWHRLHGYLVPRFAVTAVRYTAEAEALQAHYPRTTRLSAAYPYAYLLTYGAVPGSAGRSRDQARRVTSSLRPWTPHRGADGMPRPWVMVRVRCRLCARGIAAPPKTGLPLAASGRPRGRGCPWPCYTPDTPRPGYLMSRSPPSAPAGYDRR